MRKMMDFKMTKQTQVRSTEEAPARSAMKLALEALDHNSLFTSVMPGYDGRIIEKAYKAINKALALVNEVDQEQPAQPARQEPVALKWQQAPVKTQWGDDMVVASVAIDKDHTVCLYCERDQTPKVDAMFAQRTWVGLTGQDLDELACGGLFADRQKLARGVEAKLKEKNSG